MAGIVTAQTGHPYSIIFPLDNGRNGLGSGGSSHPDVIGDPYASSGPRINADGNVRTGASNDAAFSNTFLGHIGDAGRNQFYGPHYTNADISLIKNMTLTERFKLQIRSEFFNVLNHPQFAQPGGGVGTSILGYSTSTLTRSDGTTSARQIQLALKLILGSQFDGGGDCFLRRRCALGPPRLPTVRASTRLPVASSDKIPCSPGAKRDPSLARDPRPPCPRVQYRDRNSLRFQREVRAG